MVISGNKGEKKTGNDGPVQQGGSQKGLSAAHQALKSGSIHENTINALLKKLHEKKVSGANLNDGGRKMDYTGELSGKLESCARQLSEAGIKIW